METKRLRWTTKSSRHHERLHQQPATRGPARLCHSSTTHLPKCHGSCATSASDEEFPLCFRISQFGEKTTISTILEELQRKTKKLPPRESSRKGQDGRLPPTSRERKKRQGRNFLSQVWQVWTFPLRLSGKSIYHNCDGGPANFRRLLRTRGLGVWSR